MLESLEEKNNDLTKNNKQYRISFSYKLHFQFAHEDNEYLKENNQLNDDESINDNKLQIHLDNMEQPITTHSSGKKLFTNVVHVNEH